MKIFTHWPQQKPFNYFYIADHHNFRIMIAPESGFTWFFRLPGFQGKFLDFGLGPDEYDELLWECGPFHLVQEGFPPDPWDEY